MIDERSQPKPNLLLTVMYQFDALVYPDSVPTYKTGVRSLAEWIASGLPVEIKI